MCVQAHTDPGGNNWLKQIYDQSKNSVTEIRPVI